MSILITGTSGQVGTELQALGKSAGKKMICTTRTDIDLTNKSELLNKVKQLSPKVIINAAAYTAVDKAESEEDLAFAVNCTGVEHLAQACSQIDIPLIHISTDYVFDGSKKTPYTENDIVNPINVYGKSKEAGEAALRKSLAKHVILRTSWVFSPHGSNFVKSILRLAKERDQLGIVADQFGGPTSARSIASACLFIADQVISPSNENWGTYHFTGTEPTNWCKFAKAIVEKSGLPSDDMPDINPIETTQYPTPAKRPANSILDCSKIYKDFDIKQPDWLSELENVLKVIKD